MSDGLPEGSPIGTFGRAFTFKYSGELSQFVLPRQMTSGGPSTKVIHEFPPIHDSWYLTGATASGKTRIALRLADAIDAEIISLDSMAVYRGMNIGTAKPTEIEQSQVPHHLLDVVDPDQEFSLAEYLTLAHEAAEAVKSRGKQVLFVGGTPLYLKSLLRGLCEGPPADEDFRREVEAEVEAVGIGELRKRLEQVDPLSAAKLHPNDKRRMIRALEVYKLTGQPISHYQMQFESAGTSRCERVFVLGWERAQLHERINTRVEQMFEAGLVDEVSELQTKYDHFSKTALQGVGYREVLELNGGKCDLKTAVEQTKIRTRRFARRQETWFRGLEECEWISMNAKITDDEIIDQLRTRS